MREYLYFIKQTPLFTGIGDEELIALLDCLRARISKFKKHETIFMAGDLATKVGVICEGAVEVTRDDIFGNRSIIERLVEGSLFGEAFACAKADYLPVGVTALNNCTILMINFKKIVTACSSACTFHGILIENMLKIIARKNLLLNQKIEVLASRTTRGKLMAYLNAEAVKSGGNSFNIPFNRQALADYLSVERSAMSAELGRMRDEGLIAFYKNSFKLLKPCEHYHYYNE